MSGRKKRVAKRGLEKKTLKAKTENRAIPKKKKKMRKEGANKNLQKIQAISILN